MSLRPIFSPFVIFLMLSLQIPQLRADTKACEVLLAKARISYEGGRFNEVIELVTPCVDHSSRSHRQEALFLKARAHVLLDQLDDARQVLRELINLAPTSEARGDDPIVFAQILEEERHLWKSESAYRSSSVSLSDEDIREAPATVVVVTEEMIRRRGYRSIADLLEDLPGLDTVVGNGIQYMNIYPRGYRSSVNDHMLLRVDGVEQNDPHSYAFALSRQYPLSNLDKVVVVYGPVSTIYGANAYVGVIDIFTKPALQITGNKAFGARIQLLAGAEQTQSLDMTLAGQNQALFDGVSWSLTARLFQSDEQESPLYRGNNPNHIAEPIRETKVWDQTHDWFLGGELQFGRLTIGVQHWQRKEGIAPWFTDEFILQSSDNRWTPKMTAFSLDYAHDFGNNFRLTFASRYQEHELLAADTRTFTNPSLIGEPGVISWEQFSAQFRNQFVGVWNPSSQFTAVMGLDLRNRRLEAGMVANGVLIGPDDFCSEEIINGVEVRHCIPVFDEREVAFLTQFTWQPLAAFKAVVGGRWDDHNVQRHEEFSNGGQFSPRVNLVWMPGNDWVIKAIYAEAFRDSSIYETVGVFARPAAMGADLDTAVNRKVSNVELAASWEGQQLSFDVAAYNADYLESQLFIEDDGVPFESTVQGFHVNAQWKAQKWLVSGNYTYTQSEASSSLQVINDRLVTRSVEKVGDIAPNQVHLELHSEWWQKRLAVNLRTHYVDERENGGGTTVPNNPLGLVKDYWLSHLTLTFSKLFPNHRLAKGFDCQLAIRNLFDTQYAHPGVLTADGRVFAPILPQPGRSLYLSLNHTW